MLKMELSLTKGIRLPENIKANEFMFFFSYGIFLFFSILRTSLYYQYFVGILYTLIILTCVGACLVSEILCYGKMTKKALAGATILYGMYMIISYANHSLFSAVGLSPLLLLASRKIEFRKIARFSLIMMATLLIFIILSADLNVIKNIVITSSTGRRREFLGFRFPLNAPTMLFNITAIFIYLKKDSLKLIHVFVLFILNVYVYLRTDSKLSFFLSVMLIVVCWSVKFFYDKICNNKLIMNILSISFIFAFIFSIVIALMYNNDVKWMLIANELVEDRIYFANYSLKEYGVSLFGENIPWIGWGTDEKGESISVTSANYFYVDNMYIQVMQRYGVIIMAVFIAANTLTLKKAKDSKNLYCMIILSVIAMRCIIDNLSFQMYYNTFLFMISYMLFNNAKFPISSDELRRYMKKLRLNSRKYLSSINNDN